MSADRCIHKVVLSTTPLEATGGVHLDQASTSYKLCQEFLKDITCHCMFRINGAILWHIQKYIVIELGAVAKWAFKILQPAWEVRAVHCACRRWVDGHVRWTITCFCLGLLNTCFYLSHDGHNGHQTSHWHILWFYPQLPVLSIDNV